jgi:Protein of unknown function (DUF3298)
VSVISRACRFACIAALYFLWPALALGEDEKPIVSIKTKYVEIEVNIDRALHMFPQLYAALAADGKQFAELNRKEALAAWKTDPTLFRDMPWTFDRGYRLRVAALPYVSVLVDTGRFTGGAHPNTVLDTVLWDTRANRNADMESLFRETRKDGPTTTALAKLVRDAIVAEKKRRDFFVDDPDNWLDAIKPDFSTLGAPSLAPSDVAGRSSGITFHFAPYGVGPYAEGSYTAFVPFPALAPYLTDDAKMIFAGERPKSDEDE